MEFSDIILKYFSDHNILPADISKATGIDKSTFTKWRKNPTSKIELKNVVKISTYLNITIDELITTSNHSVDLIQPYKHQHIVDLYESLDNYGREAVENLLLIENKRCLKQIASKKSVIQNKEQITSISKKLITIRHSFYKVSAGSGFELDEADLWEEIDIPDTPESQKADMCLTIKGDSMEPVYKDGDIVLVKEQSVVEPGQIGIFIVEGKGYIKKYGGDRLISLNDNYDDIIFKDYDANNIRCVGAVIGRV